MAPVPVPFQAHIDLLHFFLSHRDAIAERIQGVLNAQRKPAEYLQDGELLARHFEDCFFTLPGVDVPQSRLRGQLEEAHWASGFRPRVIPGLHNGPADPAEMMMRVFYLWGQTRWPGRNGRARYAHTLFNLYVVRSLELLSMRLWDGGADGAGDRLAHVQRVLDVLWRDRTADQPVLVRDARWLIQTAQSLATDDLGAYFRVASLIAESVSTEDRIEIHKAGVRMTAGHLRSQIRYHAVSKSMSFDDPNLVLGTRTSNALDFALLVQELVPLLEAYEDAWHGGDTGRRLALADAICQGVSPDPELFVNRVELLGAYSMIEPLFITTEAGGHATYTPMGQRHVQLVQEYAARMGRLSTQLSVDCPRFRPVAGVYSPYGALFGFSADLLKHMVLKAVEPDAENRFGLEDVFVAGDDGAGKLAWVAGWRKLPHLKREVERQFDYPQQFAEGVFDRIEHALRRRASSGDADAAVHTGRLFVHAAAGPEVDSRAQVMAEPIDEVRFVSDRREGKLILGYETSAGRRTVSKRILTETLGAGRDATIAGLPPAAVEVLTLMCPGLVTAAADGRSGSSQ